MPKIKQSEKVERREMLRSNIYAIEGILRINHIGLAKILHCSDVTVRNRIKNPEKLTAEEIYNMCSIAKVDPARFISEKLQLT